MVVRAVAAAHAWVARHEGGIVSRGDSKELRRSLLPSIAALLFVVAYLVVGFVTLDETTRRVPLLAGMVTLVLARHRHCPRRESRRSPQRQLGRRRCGGVKAPESPGREYAAILLVAAGGRGDLSARVSDRDPLVPIRVDRLPGAAVDARGYGRCIADVTGCLPRLRGGAGLSAFRAACCSSERRRADAHCIIH